MDKYIGKRLDGRYEIREIIGVGGMAYVYKAYDNIDNRIVAVKILKEEYLTNEEFTRRFKNESKAIAILSHPNIVKVYDVSFGERLQYIVMECVDGITLKEYIEQQKEFKWKEAVHFTVQILRALQHAHDKGIVHRDIKPQNIMLLPDGTIKVADFGIARFSRQDIRATRSTEKAIGSVHYISPEQARGDITDEKADIYSVGVMLYEMLTGQLPFEADSAVSVAIMQLQSEAKPPREIDPAIPEGLEDITIKAMQKDPSKRYQSAAEMLNDIDEFKKNPSIHFEYKYFVDESPTRYMETVNRVKGGTSGSSAKKENDSREKKEFPIIPVLCAIAAAFLVVAMVFVGLLMKDTLSPSQTEQVIVPDFTGKTLEEVQNNREWTSWFSFGTIQQQYDDTPVGTIIGQDLASGKSVKKGTKTIILTVSLGPKYVTVPDVVGQEYGQAMETLEREKFVVDWDWEYSDTVAEKLVISLSVQYPDKLIEGSSIKMIVSKGPQPLEAVEIPDVLGMDEQDAVRELECDFTVTVKRVNKAGVSKGVVVGQSVAGGETLDPGQEIVLEVASGCADVTLKVPLPSVDLAVDLTVYIGGLPTNHSLTNVRPQDKGFWTLTLTETQEQYKVTVYIAKHGQSTDYRYAEYEVDGVNGTYTLININSDVFEDAVNATTTDNGQGTSTTTSNDGGSSITPGL